MREEIYTVYAPADDMTFIMKDCFDGNDPDPISTEVIGFYYGKTCDDLTEEYTGRLKAEY